MSALMQAVKYQAASVDGLDGKMRLGFIRNYDPSTYTAKVQIMPEGILSGWMPLPAAMASASAGVNAGPVMGDQVWVFCQEGDAEAGMVTGYCHSDANPPLAVPSGEVWIALAGGATFKLHANNTITSSGTITHTGDIHCTGTIYAPQAIINGVVQSTHEHAGVTIGGAKTGGPTN